jgi:ABC-type antimicrobial peptide transport system permease subunit
MTVDERLDSYITIQRLTALLSEFFGGVALLIACVGLYGLMSFHVTRRTMELGIRSALGADRWHLLLMVLREALVLAGLGCAVGVVVSLEAGRFVKSVLFGVSANDFVSFVLAVAVMFGVAGVAAYLPARRAAATDPMTALRAE